MNRTLVSVFAASILFAGCGGSDPAPAAVEPAPAPAVEAAPVAEAPAVKHELPGDAAAGEAVYKSNCIACHQADGTGMGGALGADLVNDKTRLAKSNEVLLKSIADGVPGTTMIAWSAVLDETQRKDVLSYIRATFGPK